MRFFFCLLLHVLIFLPIFSLAAENGTKPLTQKHQKTQNAEAQRALALKSHGRLPLSFVENNGQVDGSVKFYENGAGNATFSAEEGILLALAGSNGSAKA